MLNEQNPTKRVLVSGNEGVVIRKCLHDIAGGRTLDFSDFALEKIQSGHVVIKTSDGNYAPMPVSTGENPTYAALPEGATYAGINKHYVLKTNPEAAIMTVGAVNETLLPYPMTGIMADFKAACPGITFEQDEEA